VRTTDSIAEGSHSRGALGEAEHNSTRSSICDAALRWVDRIARNRRPNMAIVESSRAAGFIDALDIEAGNSGYVALPDIGVAGATYGLILNAIKMTAQACTGNTFSCVGRAALGGITCSLLTIGFGIVGHIVVLALSVKAGASLSIGSVGFFFSQIYEHLCSDNFAEVVREEAQKLVHELSPGTHLNNSDPLLQDAVERIIKLAPLQKTESTGGHASKLEEFEGLDKAVPDFDCNCLDQVEGKPEQQASRLIPYNRS